jgi:hypothetical protein
VNHYTLHGVGLRGFWSQGLGISYEIWFINGFKIRFVIICLNNYLINSVTENLIGVLSGSLSCHWTEGRTSIGRRNGMRYKIGVLIIVLEKIFGGFSKITSRRYALIIYFLFLCLSLPISFLCFLNFVASWKKINLKVSLDKFFFRYTLKS